MSLFKSSRKLLKTNNLQNEYTRYFDWQKKHLLKPNVFKHFSQFVEFYQLHFKKESYDKAISNIEFFDRHFVEPVIKAEYNGKVVNDFIHKKNVELAKTLGVADPASLHKKELYSYLINKKNLDEQNRLVFDQRKLHHEYYQVGDVIVLNNTRNNILTDSLNIAVIIKLPSKDDLDMVCISTTEDIMSISKSSVLFRMHNVFDIKKPEKTPSKLFPNLINETPKFDEDFIPETLFQVIPRLFLQTLELLKGDIKHEVMNKGFAAGGIVDDIISLNADITLQDLYNQTIKILNVMYPATPYSTEPENVNCGIYLSILYHLTSKGYAIHVDMIGIPHVNLNKTNELKLTNPDFNVLDMNSISADYMESVNFANLVNEYKDPNLEQGEINLYDVLKKRSITDEKDYVIRHDENKESLKAMFKDVEIKHTIGKTETKFMNSSKAVKSNRANESSIFAIDSASTVEVDDGLSLEYIDENRYKAHCYISSVSDYFAKDKLSENEKKLLENIFARNTSLYYLSNVDKMICVDAINDYYSLSANNKGKPVLKFSVVINKTQGEYKVDKETFEVAMVTEYNDLKRVTYEEAESMITSEKAEKNTMKDLFEVAMALRNDRKKSEFYKTLEFNNDNTIQVKHDSNGLNIAIENEEKKSQVLVSEFMLLFNHLTSLYCFKNKLPIIYRACPPALGKESSDQKINESILSYTANPKYAKFITPESYYTMVPNPHHATGFEFYTHITSPLRRLPDLLNNLVIIRHLTNRSLTSDELKKLEVVFEQNVHMGGQKTKKFNKYLEKYFLLKALKEDGTYLTRLLENGGVLTTSTFGDNKQTDLSHKDELMPIQNVNIVKKNVTTYKNNLEIVNKQFKSLDRVFVMFEGCIVADLEIDSLIKTQYREGDVCKNLKLHSLDPVKLHFSVKLN